MDTPLKEVKKAWGKELWIVNCPRYCGKLLYLDKGAVSSIHYHKEKQETFFCLEGQVALSIEGKYYTLTAFSRPKTIKPGQKHSFSGITNALIIEFSTPHHEKDVVRLTESKPAQFCPKLDDCLKVRMVFDKDMLEFQYGEAIRRICEKCEERNK